MNFQELIDAYIERLDLYLSEIERVCRLSSEERKLQMPTSPSYLNEVIIPVYELLAAYMRKKRRTIKIPNPETYRPIKEYYRIKVGLQTVGGFSVPDGEDFSIYFTPLKSALPIGNRVKIENEEQLGEIIYTHLRNYKEI